MISMIELETLINLFGYNFHQLAEVHRDMHGLEQNPFLLPIQLMQFLNKSAQSLILISKMHIFISV